MMLAPNPVSKIDPPVLGQEPTHGVCACQVDAAPRLALCGADCSGEDEGFTDTLCVVCADLFLNRVPCRICGGLR